MFPDLFSCLFFAVPIFFVVSGVFFFLQKDKIIKKYKQPEAVMLKNITGTITTVIKGALSYNKNFQWCSFDIFVNQNSMFLFPRSFYIIPRNCINLTFNSNRKNTRKPTVLREFHIGKNSVELICYPDYMINGKRTISLSNLTQEQILFFQKALIKE